MDLSGVRGSRVRLPAEFDHGDVPLDDVREVRAEMREIRIRHRVGMASARERRRYLACWRALALRRSPGRRPYLSREFDNVLAERSRLLQDIHAERTRQEVEAIFEVRSPGQTPTTGAGSSVPR